MNSSASATGADSAYAETRRHELRRTRMLMIDGNLAANSRTVEAGVSARVYQAGYWGFASAPTSDVASVGRVMDIAHSNARAMSRFGVKSSLSLPGGTYRGEHPANTRRSLSPKEGLERMAALHAWCTDRYPMLRSTRLLAGDEYHCKWLETTTGSRVVSAFQRALCHVTLVAEDAHGAPVEVTEQLSGKGGLAELDFSVEALAPLLDRLHEHLMAKRHAVPARGGQHTVVLAPELAGILAHEAVGHPCEADLVLCGAVTGHLVGHRVASERITIVDFAHTVDGGTALIPVHADDEGVPAIDAVLIRDGILTDFMSSRETAAQLGIAPTGNARAYGPHDEPLVRMRNTAIRSGTDKLADMIADVEEGYLLLKSSNGQADTTTEFMFGISLAYEIRGGRVRRALRDTTMSGSALKVLQDVDAVSDDNVWNCSSYCGKKQMMVVSMGGPALRTRAQLGGE